MVETLSTRQAADLLGTADFDIIDIRDEHEWAVGHVPGARVIPYETLRSDPDSYLSSKDRPVLFICAKGVRSLAMAKLADRLGYATVYSLDGGTNGWAKSGLSLEKQRVAA